MMNGQLHLYAFSKTFEVLTGLFTILIHKIVIKMTTGSERHALMSFIWENRTPTRIILFAPLLGLQNHHCHHQLIGTHC